MEGEYGNQVDIVYDRGLFKEPESLAMIGGFTESEGKVNLHIVVTRLGVNWEAVIVHIFLGRRTLKRLFMKIYRKRISVGKVLV